MKIIVTGGAGFIGSNFIAYMLKKYDYKIICLDKLTYAGNLHNLERVWHNENFKFIFGDITNKKFINDLFAFCKPDALINFAAESHVDRSIKNPNIFFNTNLTGTNVLLEACVKFNLKRFHQVSTDEVYGDLPLEDTDKSFTENSLLKPSSYYSVSKASADLLTLSYLKTFGLPITISRCTNNYGPFQFPEKLIPMAINNIMKNKKIPIYGTGKNMRDWIYVEDHCYALDLIFHNGRIGEIYNVASHNEKSNLQVVKYILELTHKTDNNIEFVEDRLGHDLCYRIDFKKISNELGWFPKITFEDGIQNTVDWYLQNKNWLEQIEDKSYKSYCPDF